MSNRWLYLKKTKLKSWEERFLGWRVQCSWYIIDKFEAVGDKLRKNS